MKKVVLIISIAVGILAVCFICYQVFFANRYIKEVGNLNNARFWHKSFLLSDGKILIIGGEEFDGKLQQYNPSKVNSIELFNPKTNKFKIILEDKRISNAKPFSIKRLTDDYFLIRMKNSNKSLIYDYKNNKLLETSKIITEEFSYLPLPKEKIIIVKPWHLNNESFLAFFDVKNNDYSIIDKKNYTGCSTPKFLDNKKDIKCSYSYQKMSYEEARKIAIATQKPVNTLESAISYLSSSGKLIPREQSRKIKYELSFGYRPEKDQYKDVTNFRLPIPKYSECFNTLNEYYWNFLTKPLNKNKGLICVNRKEENNEGLLTYYSVDYKAETEKLIGDLAIKLDKYESLGSKNYLTSERYFPLGNDKFLFINEIKNKSKIPSLRYNKKLQFELIDLNKNIIKDLGTIKGPCNYSFSVLDNGNVLISGGDIIKCKGIENYQVKTSNKAYLIKTN